MQKLQKNLFEKVFCKANLSINNYFIYNLIKRYVTAIIGFFLSLIIRYLYK